ncbi:hypothetical protein M8J75_006843 [Diaphorina citri]|nr:hypothetical protein M8J75_006843 [Diaphorina citri]
MEMCPASERALREKENLIHPLEVSEEDIYRSAPCMRGAMRARPQGPRGALSRPQGPQPRPRGALSRAHGSGKPQYRANPSLMVKCYHRSAAGVEMTSPHNLRPAPVLITTVQHLLTRVIRSTRVPWCEVHGFISDRLRCVRQDASIQQIDPATYMTILEHCILFYASSMNRPCNEHKNTRPPCIDKYLNRKQLEETLHQCTSLYDEFWDTLYTKMTSSRIQVECVHLIVNIDQYDVLHRALSLQSHTPIQSTLQLCLHYSMHNYTQVFRTLPNIPCVAATVFSALHLALFRKECMQIINSGFSCKNNYLPLSYIKKSLLLSTEAEAQYLCDYYGLRVDTDSARVLCCKADFQACKAPEEENSSTLEFLETDLLIEQLTDLNLTQNS